MSERTDRADLTDLRVHVDVITDVDVLGSLSRDQAALAPNGRPLAAVRATSVADVQAVMRWASATSTAVVVRGAGTGLAGGANAIDGCIVLDLSGMNAITDINVAERYAVVEPGVLNAELDRTAAQRGLWYPPDPSSWEISSIGGNVATNAGGLCCVKYGVTADYVLGLDVVLADGSLIHTGRRTIKGVTGLDLTHLFVGSEGTLGVVVGATLRLRPRRTGSSALVVGSFPTVAQAGAAAIAITSGVRGPSMLEIMDRTTIRAVDADLHMGLDTEAGALLLARDDSGSESVESLIEGWEIACKEAGASEVFATSEPDEVDAMFAARRAAYPALEKQGHALLEDLCVPISRLSEMLERIGAIAAERSVTIGTFGHAGDGNLHPTIVTPHGDEHALDRARAAFEDIMHAALAMGGVLSGEHGIGTLKHEFVQHEIDAPTMQAQKRIKRALDPLGILNPGRKGLHS
jgi:glycolate oxidase